LLCAPPVTLIRLQHHRFPKPLSHTGRHCDGRQLSIVGPDGSHSSAAVFFHKGRLYQIEGKALTGNEAASYAIRFQQSLVFTGGESNRPDTVREARRNCRGAAENAGAPGATASDEGQLRGEGRCRAVRDKAATRAAGQCSNGRRETQMKFRTLGGAP
jgi:hypothetical protein